MSQHAKRSAEATRRLLMPWAAARQGALPLLACASRWVFDTSADRAMVLRAATTELASTRDDVIQVVTTRLELPRKAATEAYDLAEVYEGNPRSVWGYVQG